MSADHHSFDFCDGFRDNAKYVHDAEARISAQTCDIRGAVERTGGEGRITTERDGSNTRAVVRETTCDIEKSTRDGFSTARVDVVSGFKDSLRDAERIAAASMLAQEKIAAANQLSQERIAAAGLLSQEKLAAAAALLAHQNKCDLAAQIAECCCEQKALALAQGEATRALVMKVDCDRTARELQDTKNELAMFRLDYGTQLEAALYALWRGTVERDASVVANLQRNPI